MTDNSGMASEVERGRLSSEEKDRRSGSFGESALLYERFRPGLPPEAVDWMLQTRTRTVVDLGAGTGAMTKLLVERTDRVIAVEPDERMLEVLAGNNPSVTALRGRGEAIPLPDSSADAVVASASWHWMDPLKALGEAARVLVPEASLVQFGQDLIPTAPSFREHGSCWHSDPSGKVFRPHRKRETTTST